MIVCQNNADLVPSYKYPTHPTVLSLNPGSNKFEPAWLSVRIKKKSYTRHDTSEWLKCVQEGHINNYFK